MSRITEHEHKVAQNIVDRYLEQLNQDRLDLYKTCTIDDILTKDIKMWYGNKAVSYWVTKDTNIPNWDADGTIINNTAYFTIENEDGVYDNYGDAEIVLFEIFKRKKLIDNE